MTTREVAERLGVGTTSVKRWADEGLLPCVKTAGGHRRFRRSDVESLSRSGVALHAEAPPSPGDPLSWLDLLLANGPLQELQTRLLAERGRRGSWARVSDFLGELLRDLGDGWARGEISILGEHLASERLSRVLAVLSEQIPVAPDAPRALLVSAEGDDHTLGLSILELCLRERGWQTIWAGRSSPYEEVRRLLHGKEAELVAVSAAATRRDNGELARQADQLSGMCQRAGVLLLIGGEAQWPDELDYGQRLKDMHNLPAP